MNKQSEHRDPVVFDLPALKLDSGLRRSDGELDFILRQSDVEPGFILQLGDEFCCLSRLSLTIVIPAEAGIQDVPKAIISAKAKKLGSRAVRISKRNIVIPWFSTTQH